MKKGFTMIELIFVIVILGILAAVAIPKLAATRDDANTAKAATEVATAIQDIGSYYTANGNFDGGNAPTMTNVQFNEGNTNGTADDNLTGVTTGAGAITSGGSYYAVDGVNNCIQFAVTAKDGNLTVKNTQGLSGICKDVQDLIAAKDLNKTHAFGGKRVKW